jgi:hypothetical protein
MGEFTLAALLGYPTFPVYLLNVNGYQPRMGEALVLVSFLITWAGVIALAAVARRDARHPGRPRRPNVAGARVGSAMSRLELIGINKRSATRSPSATSA